MRLALIPLLLLLSSCGRGDEGTENAATATATATVPAAEDETTLVGSGRDRMCMKNERAGFITYAASGDSNCAVRGAATLSGDTLRIEPDGDVACVIEARRGGGGFVLGEASPACAYYCGPNASFAGKSFAAKEGTSVTVDLAGDPLC